MTAQSGRIHWRNVVLAVYGKLWAKFRYIVPLNRFRSAAANFLDNCSRSTKRFVFIATDIFITALASLTAYALTDQANTFGLDTFVVGSSVVAAVVTGILTLFALGFYNSMARYMSLEIAWVVLSGSIIATVLFAIIINLGGVANYSVNYYGVYWMTLLILLIFSRAAVRAAVWNLRLSDTRRLLIYGAGETGAALAAALKQKKRASNILGFVDDDPRLHGARIGSLTVKNPKDMAEIVARRRITDVLLAMPSIEPYQRASIISGIRRIGVRALTVPSMEEILSGEAKEVELRELRVEDLLGRNPVPPAPQLLTKCVSGKSVLVTGAGGSIGSDLCKEIAKLEPRRLILLEMSELNLFNITRELQSYLDDQTDSSVDIVSMLGNVRNSKQVKGALEDYDIDTIYHVAAYKHVPCLQENILEAIANNVFGTLNVAMAAAEFGVQNAVFISTDKAVHPTSIMGASKRIGELIFQAFGTSGKSPRYSIVRFGNVLGSSGSVVPIFSQQIVRGGPITITHPDISRYFMTIREASQLILQASALADDDGNLFVLDMGEPVRIVDLARTMIDLAGMAFEDDAFENGTSDPREKIRFEFCGLRPGEKLHEELYISNNIMQTMHPRIMRVTEPFLALSELSGILDQLRKALTDENIPDIIQLIDTLVPENQIEMMDKIVHISKRPDDAMKVTVAIE